MTDLDMTNPPAHNSFLKIPTSSVSALKSVSQQKFMAVSTGSSKSKNTKKVTSKKSATKQRQLSVKLLTDIISADSTKPRELNGDTITKQLGFPLRPFQIQAINAQLNQKDVLIHAGTGMGKTVIAAGPHYHPSTAGKLSIMVSPLLALQNEQVKTFETEFGLKAIAVNSSEAGCRDGVFQDLNAGRYRILLISPELLLSKLFVDKMLRNPKFTSRVFSVVIDEAHVVSNWGSGFRKKYGELGMVRAFLPRGTPMVAMSATLPARIRCDVVKKLEYPHNYMLVNIGNDRPNVALVVRAMEHPQATYTDLNFVIPGTAKEFKNIPSCMIYADSVPQGPQIIHHLLKLLPQDMQNCGLIRPFSAGYPVDYRSKVLDLFKTGDIRILVCTDAAGMGCNIPNVDVVVQWKLPESLSSFIQRAGRAARAPGRTGLAVLLAERTAYSMVDGIVDPDTTKSKGSEKDRKGSRNKGRTSNPELTKADRLKLAVSHGLLRGSYGGENDALPVPSQEKSPNPEAPDEGLLTLVQTTGCRRRVVTVAYQNEIADRPKKDCCDVCDPTLLTRTRPGPPIKSKRQTTVKRMDICAVVKTTLCKWRSEMHSRDFPYAFHAPIAIFPDSLVELLSSIGPIDERKLDTSLKSKWLLYARYKDELLTTLKSIPASQFPSNPTHGTKGTVTTTKRKAAEESIDAQGDVKKRKPDDDKEDECVGNSQPATAIITGITLPLSSAFPLSSFTPAGSSVLTVPTYPTPQSNPTRPAPSTPMCPPTSIISLPTSSIPSQSRRNQSQNTPASFGPSSYDNFFGATSFNFISTRAPLFSTPRTTARVEFKSLTNSQLPPTPILTPLSRSSHSNQLGLNEFGVNTDTTNCFKNM